MRNNRWIEKKWIWILLILLCLVVLGFLFKIQMRKNQEIKQRIQNAVEQLEETEPETTQQETAPESSEASKEALEHESAATPNPTAESTDSALEEEAYRGIVFWGDEILDDKEAENYSWQVVFSKYLQEAGMDLQVADKTLHGASTLSVMKMAGVEQTVLDTYIQAHQEAASNPDRIPITETGIRDLTPEELTPLEGRWLPVIFMGHYGGWNYDVQELIEQQKEVLKALGNPEEFIILCTAPYDNSVKRSVIHPAMEAAWGDHYLNLSQVCSYSATTRRGQKEMALALGEKLIQMGYLKAEE